jgi:hypothetical protein
LRAAEIQVARNAHQLRRWHAPLDALRFSQK